MSTGPSRVAHATSASPEDTERLGARLAGWLPPGTTVGLVGGLGAGKTCLVRGMAAGLGVDPDLVASPTFVYLVDYDVAEERPRDGVPVRLYHADLYRLAELPDDAADRVYDEIGLFAAFDAGEMVVVEWWDCFRAPPPSPLVRVEFVIESANDRSILLEFVGPELIQAAREFGAEVCEVGSTTKR